MEVANKHNLDATAISFLNQTITYKELIEKTLCLIDAFKKLGEIVEEKSETVANPDDNHKAQEDDKKSEQDDNDKDPEDPEDPPTTNPAPTPAEKEPFSAITGMFAELETTAGNSSKSEETTKPLTQNPPSKEAEEQSSQTDPMPETEVSPSANFHKPEDNNIPTGQVKVRRKKTKKVNPNQGSLFDFSDQPVPKTENHPATNNNEDSAMTGFDSNDTKPVSTLPETEERKSILCPKPKVPKSLLRLTHRASARTTVLPAATIALTHRKQTRIRTLIPFREHTSLLNM